MRFSMFAFFLYCLIPSSGFAQYWDDPEVKELESYFKNTLQGKVETWTLNHLVQDMKKIGEDITGHGGRYFKCTEAQVPPPSGGKTTLRKLNCIKNSYAFLVGIHASYNVDLFGCSYQGICDEFRNFGILFSFIESEKFDSFGNRIGCFYYIHQEGLTNSRIDTARAIIKNGSTGIQVAGFPIVFDHGSRLFSRPGVSSSHCRSWMR